MSGCGLYGYLLTPAGAHKLIDAIRQDLCFGHVDWRVLRYCVTPGLVEKVIPATRVAEILRNHHHWQPPAWGILRACTLGPEFDASYLDVEPARRAGPAWRGAGAVAG